ncbi:MAG: O-antigen ligase family protein [bacterium]
MVWLEIPLFIVFLYLFSLISDKKDISYAIAIFTGLGLLVLAFFRHRWGMFFIICLLFIESTVNLINTLAKAAISTETMGLPTLTMTPWFSMGVLSTYFVLLLSYLCWQFLNEKKRSPLNFLEWILLIPLLVMITYIPYSLIRGNTFSDIWGDSIPMMLYAGIVIAARNFSREGDYREARYSVLDWFLIANLVILIPLWAYNIAFNPFRSSALGIAAIRYGTGPYDFNFFLVPLLGMIITYDDNLGIVRKRFYTFSFFFCTLRILISLFRGAMAGTILALIIVTFLVDSTARRKWLKNLFSITVVSVALMGIIITVFPIAGAVFNVVFLGRIKKALFTDTGDTSLQFRHLETQVALDDIREEPVFGYGPGSLINKNFDSEEYTTQELYLHSGFVWFWYKLGILGLLLLAAFFIGIYMTCFSLLRRTLHPPDRGWVIGTLAATIAMLPVIQTNNMVIRSQGAYALTLLLMGLCLITYRYRGIPRDRLPGDEGKASG